MSEGGWLSEDMVARANKIIQGLNAGLESTDETLEEMARRMHKAIAGEYEAQQELPIDRYGIKPHPHTPIKNKDKLKELETLFNRIASEFRQERKDNMKIEDCKTVPEFFGVNIHDHIWVEGKRFKVYRDALGGEQSAPNEASRALVGCLTGQLEWSKYEPMTAEEEKILREIAAWFPDYDNLLMLNANGTIKSTRDGQYGESPFGSGDDGSKAYRVLAPILEKYGEINLDEYRGNDNERD